MNGTWEINPAPLPDTTIIANKTYVCDGDTAKIIIPNPEKGSKYSLYGYKNLNSKNNEIKVSPELLTQEKNNFRIIAENKYGCKAILNNKAKVVLQYK